jgi:hypothetical protein
VGWSAQNPIYGAGVRDDHGVLWSDVVRDMWQRARADRNGPAYTLGTLIREVREAGGGVVADAGLGELRAVESMRRLELVEPSETAPTESLADKLRTIGDAERAALYRPENLEALAVLRTQDLADYEAPMDHWRDKGYDVVACAARSARPSRGESDRSGTRSRNRFHPTGLR